MRSGRCGQGLLLATSSVAALLIGGGMPRAYAQCANYTNTTAPGCTNSSNITGIAINNSTVTSTIENTGTISPNGVVLSNASTITGTIYNDSGTLAGGITLSDSASKIVGGSHNAIISFAVLSGGISNAGAISGADAIHLEGTFSGGIVNAASGIISGNGSAVITGNLDTFPGGITNSGTISAVLAGILLTATTFLGGITNSGTISAGTALTDVAIEVAGSTFSGNIVNSAGGLISGGTEVQGAITIEYSTFSAAITNAGTISAGATDLGIVVRAGAISFGFGAPQFGSASAGGGIVNSGAIIAGGGGIWVGGTATGGTFAVSSFAGGITNSGTISARGTNSFGLGGNGIIVGGVAGTGGTVMVSTFVGGIVNSGVGLISALGNGIEVGGFAGKFAGGASGGSINIVSFGGGITNSATILASGKGILVGATVTAASSVTISTFSGGISNSGTISANTGIAVNGVLTFQGVIANSGAITGTGGTAIDLSAEPAAMTVDITAGSISGNIVGSGTGNGDTVNFNLGAGGSFVYANTISAMQTVAVNSGTLFDGGAIVAGSVNVNAGATLAPGAPGSVGTLAVTGSLVFASAAAYLDTINATTASKTVVTGTATLGGASVQIAAGSTVTLGNKYTILTDTGGGLGGSNIFNPNVSYGGHNGTLSYDADDVYLTFINSLLVLLPPGAPGNDVAVANGIDNFINGGGTLPPGFVNLFNLSGPQLEAALTKLDGEAGTGAQTGTFTLMTEFLELMLGDNSGVGGSNGGLGFAPDQQTELPPDIALAYDSILKAPPKQTFDNRWSVWGSGFGGTSITSGNAAVGSSTVTATTYGTAAGMEYRPDPNTRLGFALAGSGLNWGLAQNLGSGRSDAFQAGVYGKTYLGPAYLSGALAFGNNWFTTNRTALGDQLTASFTGQSYAIRAEGGYRFAVPLQYAAIGATPYAALQTQWFRTPAYSETDLTGGGFGLSYNANTANDTRSELGTRFDNLTSWNNKPLILRASLAWAHDWTSGTGLNAAFQALPGSAFTVNGAAVPPDSALTTASAQYYFTPDLSFTAKFDGEFAPTSQTYAGSGTLKYTW